MAWLLDTNILVRLANANDALHPVASGAVAELHRRGDVLHITSQNLIEFWNVATRPVAVNGLGLSAAQTNILVTGFERIFPLLAETPDIFPAWRALVSGLGVIGKQVHDARLVAVCHVHRVTHLLTFNTAHFTRLAGFPPGIVVVDPSSI